MQVPILLFYLLLSHTAHRISGFANSLGVGYRVESEEEEEGEVAYVFGGKPGFGGGTGVHDETSRSDFPQVASLRFPNRQDRSFGENHFCGGTLIAPNVVITAAHCVESEVLRNPDVHLGRVTREGDDFGRFESFSVVETRIHPDYEVEGGWQNHDLALLVLDRPAKTPPAKLRIDDCVESGMCPIAMAWGWGLTEARSLSEFIMKVDLPTISRRQCDAALPGLITKAMVCAGGVEGKDACLRDSGGPLEVDGEVIGVVSWGDGCGERGKFGVYASVASMQEWIHQELKLISKKHGVRHTPAHMSTRRTKTTKTRTKTTMTKSRNFITKTKTKITKTKTTITRFRGGRRKPCKLRRLLVEPQEVEP